MKKTVATILLLASTLLPQLASAQTTDEKIADMRDALAHVIIALTQNGLLTTDIVNAVITEYNRRMAAIWGISEPLLPQQSVLAGSPTQEVSPPTCTLTAEYLNDFPKPGGHVRFTWNHQAAGGQMWLVDHLGGAEVHTIDGEVVNIGFKKVGLPTAYELQTKTTADYKIYSDYYRLTFSDGTECFAKTK